MTPKPLNDLSHIPRWWRRLFPELKMLENNGLYAAFRVRREQLQSRHRVRKPFLLAGGVFACLLVVVYFRLPDPFGEILIMAAFLGTLILLLSIFGIGNLGRRKHPTDVPETCKDLFLRKGGTEEQLLDVLLTPATGREFLAAVSLEPLRRWPAWIARCCAVAGIVLIFALVADSKGEVFLVALTLSYVPTVPLGILMSIRITQKLLLQSVETKFLVAPEADPARKILEPGKPEDRKETLKLLVALAIPFALLIALALVFERPATQSWLHAVWNTFTQLPPAVQASCTILAAVALSLLNGLVFYRTSKKLHEKYLLDLDRLSEWLSQVFVFHVHSISGDELSFEEHKRLVKEPWEELKKKYEDTQEKSEQQEVEQ
ncbi:hypothetical protein KQI84_08290 [bacterium]|nr:hypothetical protein [bacterium]